MHNHLLYILLIFATLFSGCELQDFNRPEPSFSGESAELLILSEGLFNMNNSSLAFYNLADGTYDYNIFKTLNKRGLGDTANDMVEYGNKIYIAVAVSSEIEILDGESLLSIAQIPLFSPDGIARQPRRLLAYNGSLYISCFDGSLVELDTLSLSVSRMTSLGRNPEHFTVANNKIYVSNSGGLDYPYYDTTVSVVDLNSFSEIKRISVGTNPGCIGTSGSGDVYVISRGNYGTEDYTLHKIDTEIDTVIRSFQDIHPLGFCIEGDYLYMYNYNFTTQSNWIRRFNCLDDCFDNWAIDSPAELETPYSIKVNSATGEIFITDAKNFVLYGDVFCFSADGSLKYRIPEVGLNPNCIIFKK